MTTIILLEELYKAAFNGDIDKVTALTDRLLKKGIKYRVINKVFTLANASMMVENIYLTIRGVMADNESFSFSMN
jgi:hypothetical protein